MEKPRFISVAVIEGQLVSSMSLAPISSWDSGSTPVTSVILLACGAKSFPLTLRAAVVWILFSFVGDLGQFVHVAEKL